MAEWKFIGARRYECSACGEGIAEMPCDWSNGEPLYNFCPYCGANMNMKEADGRYEPQGDDIDCDRYVITNDKGERAYNCIGCQTDCAWK